MPEAQLHLIGSGTQTEVAEGLAREGVEWERRLEPPELAAAVDAARALLLPSASEGLPRVAIESFARGRAVIGTRAGGIPDIVQDGVNGLLVEPRRHREPGRGDRADPHRSRACRPPRRRRSRERRRVGLDAGRIRRPGPRARRRRARDVSRPRLLMVARTRYPLPLPESTERKFAALGERFDLRVLATAADGQARDDGVFQLVGRARIVDGPLFYLRLPFRVRRLAGALRPRRS